MPDSLGALRAAVILATIATGTMTVGALILIGGQARFSSVGFATARQVAPWWIWGLALFGAGLLALVGILTRHPWWCRIGHSLSSVAYGFLVFTFILTAIGQPTAALTGIGIYGALAVAHAIGAATADVTPLPIDQG